MAPAQLTLGRIFTWAPRAVPDFIKDAGSSLSQHQCFAEKDHPFCYRFQSHKALNSDYSP